MDAGGRITTAVGIRLPKYTPVKEKKEGGGKGTPQLSVLMIFLKVSGDAVCQKSSYLLFA